MKVTHKGNNISHKFFEAGDFNEKEILESAASKLDFKPAKLIDRSAWWGSSKIGAFRYSGVFHGKKAVVKVQLVKPETSEVYMIESFQKNNKSRVLRPPKVYAHIPWDSTLGYEAMVMEYIDGKKIVTIPTSQKQLQRFFELFCDYRQNCFNNPWLKKPKLSISQKIRADFANWQKISQTIYPDHPLREKGDQKLVEDAVLLLEDEYKGVNYEFMHAHLSAADLYQTKDRVVVLSNLYWSFRQPFYDAVFGFHWFIYNLSSLTGITPARVEEQRALWHSNIANMPSVKNNIKLLNLALLERAAAGLNLDALSCDTKKPISAYIVEKTRESVKTLIAELS